MSETAIAPSGFDMRVYHALAAYAWDEAECWPAQSTIARDIGCSREAVNRSVHRLIGAGWVAIVDRRWSPRSRWQYNVYELYERFQVGALAVKRVVRRAHSRRKQWADWVAGTARDGSDHTNTKCSSFRRCSCKWCSEDMPVPEGQMPSQGKAQTTKEPDEAKRKLGEKIQEALRAEQWLPGDHRFVKLWHDGERWWDERPWLEPKGARDEEECIWAMKAGGELMLIPDKHRTWACWLDPQRSAEFDARMEELSAECSALAT